MLHNILLNSIIKVCQKHLENAGSRRPFNAAAIVVSLTIHFVFTKIHSMQSTSFLLYLYHFSEEEEFFSLVLYDQQCI